jgi:hypothetical protein
MQSLLQKICWNLDGWRRPSGVPQDKGNPGKHGWGNEEWNFRTEDAVNGYVYGFLQYRPSNSVQKKANNEYEIGFWTINPQTKQRWLVGFYHNAAMVSERDRLVLDREFKRRGIYDRRIEEMREALPNRSVAKISSDIFKSVAKGWINFKCKISDVEVLSIQTPMPRKLFGKHVSEHYKTATLLAKPIDVSKLTKAAAKSNHVPGTFNSPLAEDGYLRLTPESSARIIPRHNILSNHFATWLKGRFTDIAQEKGRVDVEFRDGDKLCRAELKVCGGIEPRKAIREALGQLLEYNFYGGRTLADEWFIVLDQAPSPEDLMYLGRLVRELSMPIRLCWQEGADFRMSLPQ